MVPGRLCLKTMSRLSVCLLLLMSIAAPCLADSPVTAVTQGGDKMFVVRANGSVSSCGYNHFGALGDGTVNDRSLLGPVLIGNACKVVATTGGMALLRDGTVWTWGSNEHHTRGYRVSGLAQELNRASIGNMCGVKYIAGSLKNCFAIKSDGSVWAWGDNDFGSLGTGDTTPVTTPVPVRSLPPDVESIAAGDTHTLALDSHGNVWAWGSNSHGQLGDGTTNDHHVPVQVPVNGAMAIAVGQHMSLALKDDGTVWAWGDNSYGQLGDGTFTGRSTPAQVPGLAGVVAISAYGSTVMALKSDGTIWAWGGDGGSLGYSDSRRVEAGTPAKTSIENAAAISCGTSYIVLKKDGSVWAWGSNGHGQLGIGFSNDEADSGRWFINMPAKVDLTPATAVITAVKASQAPAATPTPTPAVTPTTTPQPVPTPTPVATHGRAGEGVQSSKVSPTAVPQDTQPSTSVTPVPLPAKAGTETSVPAPGMDFHTLALGGCMLALAGIAASLKREK